MIGSRHVNLSRRRGSIRSGRILRTVLLAGGAGYIGSHTAKYLASRGILPVTFDNLSRGHREAVRWGPFERGDIQDRETLLKAFARHKPEAVLHFAAFAYVEESVREPVLYYRNNVAGTVTLLEAMRESGIGRLVFSSSCATYGVPASLPIREDAPQRPINPYGWGKLMVERMLGDCGNAFGLRHVSLRYFNAAGADPEGEIGEDHDPETHLIPSAILAALGRRPALTVYGTDHPTADGTCVRDFVHVNDLAQAHYLALEYLARGGESDAFNLGNGGGHSIREVIAAVSARAGKAVPVVQSDRRPGDPPALVGSSTKARLVLGWRPAYPSLETLVDTAWKWQSKTKGPGGTAPV